MNFIKYFICLFVNFLFKIYEIFYLNPTIYI